MAQRWPAVSFDRWGETCDTLHAHTQLLGKLAVELAPPEPELQHGALRLSARGWETAPLPAPDGSGSLVAALDLRVPGTARGSMARTARRRLRPCALRLRPGSGLLRGGHPGDAGAGRVPRALPRPVHPRQRVVGNVRPGRDHVLRPV